MRVHDNSVTSIQREKRVHATRRTRAAVRVGYKKHDGATNSFDLDIVYSIGKGDVSLLSQIESSQTIRASAFKKIIADKITACDRFKSGILG